MSDASMLLQAQDPLETSGCLPICSVADLVTQGGLSIDCRLRVHLVKTSLWAGV